MILKDIILIGIGPFKRAMLDFRLSKEELSNSIDSKITILTGLNGTGKTIIIDAIRSLFLKEIERQIVNYALEKGTQGNECLIRGVVNFYGYNHLIDIHYPKTKIPTIEFMGNKYFHYDFFNENFKEKKWVLDYWSSTPASNGFKIANLEAINPDSILHILII